MPNIEVQGIITKIDNKNFTFVPDSNLLESTEYKIIVTKDVLGLTDNKNCIPFVSNFTTEETQNFFSVQRSFFDTTNKEIVVELSENIDEKSINENNLYVELEIEDNFFLGTN